MYRMHSLSGGVRAGITSRGELNIEVPGNNELPDEVLVPAEAVEELFDLLRRNV